MCFEVEGAELAQRLLERMGMPADEAERVAIAIILHMQPAVTLDDGVEAVLLDRATASMSGARTSSSWTTFAMRSCACIREARSTATSSMRSTRKVAPRGHAERTTPERDRPGALMERSPWRAPLRRQKEQRAKGLAAPDEAEVVAGSAHDDHGLEIFARHDHRAVVGPVERAMFSSRSLRGQCALLADGFERLQRRTVVPPPVVDPGLRRAIAERHVPLLEVKLGDRVPEQLAKAFLGAPLDRGAQAGGGGTCLPITLNTFPM